LNVARSSRSWLVNLVQLGVAALPLFAAASLVPHRVAAKELLYLTDSVPGGLDVDGPTSSGVATQTGIVNLLDTLLDFRQVGLSDGVRQFDFSQFEGRLAEYWTFDPATLTLTIKLRQGVKSCDGDVFTADDVLYSFGRALSVSGAGAIAWLPLSQGGVKGFTSAVFGNTPEAIEARKLTDSEIHKVDDYTLEIHQATPSSLLLTALTIFATSIYDHKAMQAHATPQDPWSHDYANNLGAAGFGPYCLDHWQKDKDFVVTANPNYYRGKPDIDRVTIQKVAQSSQRMVLLRSGDAQLVDKLNPREYLSLRDTPTVHVASSSSNSSTFMLANWTKTPWMNKLLRAAVVNAIPYDSIIKNVYFGQSKRYDGVIPSSYPGSYTPVPGRGFDLAKARAELAEAGFPEGKGLEAFADSFKLSYPTESQSVLGPVATIIQSSLKSIGVPVILNPIPLGQLLDRALVKRDLEFALIDFSKSIGMDSAFAIQLYYVSKDKGGVANYSLYSNRVVDDLYLNHAKTEIDPAKRLELLHQIQAIIYDDVGIFPITENNLQWAMTPKLSGVGFRPDQAVRFFDLKLAD
jgi:peptide/nickel transport system substrate-binding protein